MNGHEWVRSVKVTPWDIFCLKETMFFTADRMMEMLRPSEKSHQDMQTHVRLMSHTPNLDTHGILQIVASMYVTSTEIHRAAIKRWGYENVHDWIAVFLEYQSIMSCAQRQLQKEVDKELLA